MNVYRACMLHTQSMYGLGVRLVQSMANNEYSLIPLAKLFITCNTVACIVLQVMEGGNKTINRLALLPIFILLLLKSVSCCWWACLALTIWRSRTIFIIVQHTTYMCILLSYTAFWEWTIWGSCLACCNISKSERLQLWYMTDFTEVNYFIGKIHVRTRVDIE